MLYAEELNKDLSEWPAGEVYFYLYEIEPVAPRPAPAASQRAMVRVFLTANEPPTMIHFTAAAPDPDEAGEHELFMEIAATKLAEALDNKDVIEKWRDIYKGYVRAEWGTILVFNLTDIDLSAAAEPKVTLKSYLIDEIINPPAVAAAAAPAELRALLLDNETLLYITDEDGENMEIPIVMWGTGARDFSAAEGAFFYFQRGEPTVPPLAPSLQKFAGWTEFGATEYSPTGPVPAAAVIYSSPNKWCFKSAFDFVSL